MSDFDEYEFEISGTGIELRTAGRDDEDLIRRIVTLATYWRTDDVPHELPDTVEMYFLGWGRPGDIGVFSFQGIEFVGGAFVGQFGSADDAYGYVADEYPVNSDAQSWGCYPL